MKGNVCEVGLEPRVGEFRRWDFCEYYFLSCSTEWKMSTDLWEQSTVLTT